MDGFGTTIDDAAAIRDRYGQASRRAIKKCLPQLDRHATAFIDRSPFALVATTSAEGAVDVSPRGGPPGFTMVLDDRRLLLGDLPGNNRLDSLINITETGQVGMLFMTPGVDETLRVNGSACITVKPALLEVAALDGRRPKTAIGVEVREVYFHCAKAMRRSSLWHPEKWPSADEVASLGWVLVDQLPDECPGVSGDAIDADLEKGYAATLWND
jgi:hypothetical protein